MESFEVLIVPIGGVQIGIDAEQISSLQSYTVERANGLDWLHQPLALEPPEDGFDDLSILYLKNSHNRCSFITTKPVEMIRVTARDIKPFPRIMEPWVRQRGLWAVLCHGQRLIYLLDFVLLNVSQPE